MGQAWFKPAKIKNLGTSSAVELEALLRASRVLEGPLSASILHREGQVVLIFGEVHSRSACSTRAMNVLEFLEEHLTCDARVDLFVEDEVEKESDGERGITRTADDGSSTLERLRARASQHLNREGACQIRVHYTDPRGSLCMPDAPAMADILETLVQLPGTSQVMCRLMEEVVRQPLAQLFAQKRSGEHQRNPRMRSFYRLRKSMPTRDTVAYNRLLDTLRELFEKADHVFQQVLRDTSAKRDIPRETWFSLLNQYTFLANRVHDLYAVARMLQPKVRVAVVYVGQNHAQFLSQFLPRQLGFTTHASFGKPVHEADGCLRLVETT